MSQKKPLALIILDGWGYREEQENNAVAHAQTPNMDALAAQYPNTLISGSGLDVGLPDGQMGNSEVGHVNLGAGRVVYQDFTKITKAIEDGEFNNNPALVDNLDAVISTGKAVHIMGLLSPGGVHSHQDHIIAMIKLAAERGAKEIYLHAFLDGRDTAPRSASDGIAQVNEVFADLGIGKIASMIGRYYAMDRDQRWDRVQLAYELIANGKSIHQASSAEEGLAMAYQRDENDEFVQATSIGEAVTVKDGDAIFFMNFRADRAREITRAFIDQPFVGFERNAPTLSGYVMLTQYAASFDAPCAFPPTPITNSMGEWLAKNDKTQMRISETEKYAHVTFFFSGGQEEEYPGETRALIPSPDVATYDLQPEMNSEQLTNTLIEGIQSGEHDVIICNYPNGDMVGHSGVFSAAVTACEAVDTCVGRVVEAIKSVGGECLITADHGNAELMLNAETGQAHTAHTNLPVPFIYVGRDATVRSGGILSDVAPTMLHLMGLEIPAEMTGTPIVTVD